MARGAITLLLVTLAFTAAGSAEPAGKPAIGVVDRAPVTVRGTGFGARERVVVTVSTSLARVMQRTTTTYRGSFVVRFESLRLSGCGGVTVVAIGARGHVAQLKFGLRECPGPVLGP